MSRTTRNKFPRHTVPFPGSVLYGDGPGRRRCPSDTSGNGIPPSTFGDELPSLPAMHSQDHAALPGKVNAAKAARTNPSPA